MEGPAGIAQLQWGSIQDQELAPLPLVCIWGPKSDEAGKGGIPLHLVLAFQNVYTLPEWFMTHFFLFFRLCCQPNEPQLPEQFPHRLLLALTPGQRSHWGGGYPAKGTRKVCHGLCDWSPVSFIASEEVWHTWQPMARSSLAHALRESKMAASMWQLWPALEDL